MSIQEFIDRTNFIPVESEWDTIQEAYMLSPLSKDQFCRLWKKINSGRVKEEREKREYKTKLEMKMLRVKFQVRDSAVSEWYRLEKENLKCYLLNSEMPLFLEKVLSLRKGQQMTFNCACGFQIYMLCR